jgi:hypothetical protein
VIAQCNSALQGLDYPLQLMVDLFGFPARGVRDPAMYPKTGEVASVCGYRPTGPTRTAGR